MATRFTAKVLHMGIEEDVMMFGLADDKLNVNEYLLFQQSLEVDEQDAALGMDRVYIVYGDQSRSSYGGVEEMVIGRSQVTVKVNAKTASTMGTEQVIEISVAADFDPEKVERFVKRMFE